jgi:choice-of-anchor C domain-containing protein
MPGRFELGFVAAVILVAAALPVKDAQADMATNGGFEQGPTIPASGELQLAVGQTAITGWLVTRAPINLVSDFYWTPGEGTRSLGLNAGAAPGGIAQTFATAPGAVYRVGFQLSGEPFTTPVIKQIRVSAAGQHGDFTFDTTDNWHWLMLWAPHTWTFTANAASTTVEFASLMNVNASPALDDVTLTLVTAGVPPQAGEFAFALALASPNPARGGAAFVFSLPAAGPATLELADAQGRHVATLAAGEQPAGPHAAGWSASGAAPGIYFVTLRASHGAITRRFALLR